MAFESAVEVVEPGRLTRGTLDRIFAGRLGAARVRGFWPADQCAKALRSIDLTLFERYNPGHYSTQAFRIGPSLNDHRLSGTISERYWPTADLWRRRMSAAGLHDAFLQQITAAWGGPVRAATSDGRTAYWGIVRRMADGTMVHWDDVRTEFPEPIFDDVPTGQITVNVFLAAPQEGGELSVWSRPREAAHENARTGYGYRREDVVPEPPEVCARPEAGDAIFFSSCNYHAVTAVRRGDRVAFSLFMGPGHDGTLMLWS
jgi:2OG-Fe(II) oxygenase superfamily